MNHLKKEARRTRFFKRFYISSKFRSDYSYVCESMCVCVPSISGGLWTPANSMFYRKPADPGAADLTVTHSRLNIFHFPLILNVRPRLPTATPLPSQKPKSQIMRHS